MVRFTIIYYYNFISKFYYCHTFYIIEKLVCIIILYLILDFNDKKQCILVMVTSYFINLGNKKGDVK